VTTFGYLRVSGLGQVDGDGFPRQRAAIERVAPVDEWYQEEGVTGTVEHRPALSKLIRRLRPGDVVIIEKLDRLARDLMVQEVTISGIQEKGCVLQSAFEPDLCSKDATRVLMRQVLGAIAQYDRTTIVDKLRQARDRKKLRGGPCEGQKAFGHRPGEGAIIERAKELRANGHSLDSVTAALNAEYPNATRHGGRWLKGNVRRILKRLGESNASTDLDRLIAERDLRFGRKPKYPFTADTHAHFFRARA